MVGHYRLILSFLLLSQAGTAWAADSNLLSIPQVSDKPKSAATVGEKEKSDIDDSDENRIDHQEMIMKDPTISDYGRAQAIINQNAPAGTPGANIAVIKQDSTTPLDETKLDSNNGNVAIIHQSGNANSSTIVQNGKNNVASQTQKGNANDIYVKQQGDNNKSTEKQTGNHNHKIKIQNGKKTETETNESPK